jgi:hypothetical protein
MFRCSSLLGAGALALLCGTLAQGPLHAQGRARPAPRPQPTPLRLQVGPLRPGPLRPQPPTLRPHPGPFRPHPGCSHCGRPQRRCSDRCDSGRGRGCPQGGSGGPLEGGIDASTNVITVEDSVGPYLQGAADITRANAEYQQMIQEARLGRERANQEHLVTRRRMIEQAEWERGRIPSPEAVRQEELARALDRARVNPPLTEIWSGESLNALLGNLLAGQRQGGCGARVPLDEEMLRCINVTTGDTRGNAGLLRDGGALEWPPSLQGEAFKDGREGLSRGLKAAVRAAQRNGGPGTLNALRDHLKGLNDTLDAQVTTLSSNEFVQARRYLKQVGDAVTALSDPKVSYYLDGTWQARGKDVSELVRYMGANGLRFAPATPGDEPAYLALYNALAAYDARMTPVANAGVPPRMPGAADD